MKGYRPEMIFDIQVDIMRSMKNHRIMNNKTKSLVFILLSSLSFAFMSVIVKDLNDVPILQKVFFRNLVSLIITFLIIRKARVKLWGRPENRKFLILRSLLGLSGVFLYFYAISNMNLADSSMLNKISPFFVTIFAFLFLKEKIYKQQIIALVTVFAASLLIIKPEFNLSIIPALSGFFSAIFAGAAYTTVRSLGVRNEKPQVIVFYFSLISVIVVLPLFLMNFNLPDFSTLIKLLLIGTFAAGGQFGLTYAYKYAKASEVSIYNYTNILFAGIMGYLFWKEIPDNLSILGSIIIIAASVYIFIFNRKKSSK